MADSSFQVDKLQKEEGGSGNVMISDTGLTELSITVLQINTESEVGLTDLRELCNLSSEINLSFLSLILFALAPKYFTSFTAIFWLHL